MEFKVIKDAFFNKSLVREGQIIEADFTKKNMPSWCVPFKTAQKKNEENQKNENVNIGQSDSTVELTKELEHLKDIAIDNNIVIPIEPTMPINEVIAMFKAELTTNGIEY